MQPLPLLAHRRELPLSIPYLLAQRVERPREKLLDVCAQPVALSFDCVELVSCASQGVGLAGGDGMGDEQFASEALVFGGERGVGSGLEGGVLYV